MQFFYTGAPLFNTTQQNIDKSLGGFLSNTSIPNNLMSNVFSDVSATAQRKGYVETKGIVLKNVLGTTATNVYLYHTYPADTIIKLEWAAVTLVAGQQMEKIANFRATPYVGTFHEPKDVGSQILLSSSMLNGDVIGLWVRRTVLLPDAIDSISPANLQAYLTALLKKESINVTISYT